jgi:hypothetical protein
MKLLAFRIIEDELTYYCLASNKTQARVLAMRRNNLHADRLLRCYREPMFDGATAEPGCFTYQDLAERKGQMRLFNG